jgi:two-component system sensor histidine kinase KdpD
MMLLFDRERPPGPQVVSLIERTFRPRALILFDAEEAKLIAAGNTTPELERRAWGAYLSDRDRFDQERAIWCSVVRLGLRPQGALAIQSHDISPQVVSALASLTAIALERARSFETASHALADRATEQLRYSLTKHLLQTAKLDSSEVRLNRDPLSWQEIIHDAIRTVADRMRDRNFAVDLIGEQVCASVDRDLMSLAFGQLLDNALKYSCPDSKHSIRGSVTDGEIRISVHNFGSAIPKEERTRIFDRFYRLPGTENRAGSLMPITDVFG